ncbi:MAG: DUF6340 family protein [Bacteroidales bacterium]
MKKLLILIAVTCYLSSCKMQQLYLTVVEPAPVTLPAGIKSIGVLDRSNPGEAVKQVDVIDKVLTLEGAELDKEGAKACIDGLSSELNLNKRFTTVMTLPPQQVTGAVAGIFPSPLNWETVQTICAENKVDALFSLEMFDTDTKVSYQIKKGNAKTLLGAVTGLEQQADMLTTVKSGWRIYDPATRIIPDEFVIVSDLKFSATGITQILAAAALKDRKEAVRQVSTNAGMDYAMRILPVQLRVQRDYFVKGTDRFKTAMRKARTGNWDQAGELWLKETENGSSRIAGRACYNMAIISEINGDLDNAVSWARKAYEDYNTKQAVRYLRVLENRKVSNVILEEQKKD